MSNNPEVVLKVENIVKNFHLPHEKSNSLKSKLLHLFKKKDKGYEIQHALKGVSFEIKKGEFFGIVGRNGSGKSTLLKIMAEIYQPTSGKVSKKGKLVPFIELGVGFNPELTGRENVFLNGALLGFSRKEVEAMYDDIVEFAELEQFMDQKLKNYSSGMQVRLAFSVAIKAEGDILVLDEVLAVGDEAFQRKCNDYFEKIGKDKTKTIILVTHSMDSVRKYCSRAMLLYDGKAKLIGNPDVVADEYSSYNLPQAKKKKEDDDKNKPHLKAEVISSRRLKPQDTLEVKITYKMHDDRPVFAKAYIDHFGQAVMATNPGLIGWDHMITQDTKEHTAIYKLPLERFNKGEYKVIAILEDVKTKLNLVSYGHEGETLVKIENLDLSSSGGIFANQAEMSLEE